MPAFDQFRIRARLVVLHVDEVLPGAEEGRWDHTRRFLVLRDERGASDAEPSRVVLGDALESARCRSTGIGQLGALRA